MHKLLALMLTACGLPHVPPAPRSAQAQAQSVVVVESECVESDPFNTGPGIIPGHAGPDAQWAPSNVGAGVIISDNRILTAAHVVECPLTPSVHVTLANGRRVRMMVELDDKTFGHGQDIARLKIPSQETFDLGIAPPSLVLSITDSDEEWCAWTAHGEACGEVIDSKSFTGVTKSGDSGAAVYDSQGRLVGLVVSGPQPTGVVRVGTRFLE